MKRVAWVCLVAAGCAARPPAAGPGESSGELGQSHPLNGKIFDTRSDGFVELDVVRDRVRGAQLVLLGEKHDNPAHHLGQAELLRMIVDAGREPSVVWEMIHRKQGLEEPLFLGSADAFGESLRWSDSGWPDFEMYKPIVEVALAGGLPQHAGNLEPEAMRTAYTEGLSGLQSERAWAVGVDKTLEGEALANLRQEIEKAHCGYGDPNMLDSMAAAQQSRDAFMAKQLREYRLEEGGAVLIAGGGHVRRDRGVPFHLVDGVIVTADQLLVVVWVEVQDDKVDPRDYTGGDTPMFDLVFFTPRVSSEDPCDEFAEQVERIRKQVDEEKKSAEAP